MFASHYRVVHRLGAGAMGEVFLAEDTRLQRQVALKVISQELASDPDQRGRFLREARSASILSHPNICVVHEIGETEDGRPFLAMEYVEGQTLEDRTETGPLPVSETVDIVLQIADALDTAHTKGIVHRDIKPSNITVNERGRIKVLDFGLAKQFAEEGTSELKLSSQFVTTQTGTVLGTPAYMSPEQALARATDPRSDLFSLGSVLYNLLTGRLPFTGSTYGEVLDKVIHRQPDAIARFNYGVPVELERITLKLMAKQPERRYQSARDLIVDLENLRGTLDAAEQNKPELPSALPDENFASVETVATPGVVAAVAGEQRDTLSKSDVVIAYANLDDQPLVQGQQGWISQLRRNLELRVAQLSGAEVKVIKQSEPSSAEELEARVLQQVPEAKTIVSVLSPPFVRSEGCRRVVQAFYKSATDSGLFQVGDRSRILNVVKTPVAAREIPEDIALIYSKLPPYEFFDRDAESGRLREYDEAFGHAAKQRFYERVYDVAFDISQVLKHFGDASTDSGAKASDAKTIFLATTTSDLELQRDRLRRELTELGHEVLPKQALPLVASEIESVVRSCLERCDLAIHPVGAYYGLVPEATELSVVALQNQVAAELCARSDLRRIIWFPKGFEPRDERQIAFIRDLEANAEAQRGAELILDTMENLKGLLRQRWQREAAGADRPAATSGPNGPPRVYLICDRQDEEAIEPLEDFFYEQGVELSLPGFEAGESEVQEIHIRNLRDCDAALIYYGTTGMHWVDFNIRDLQKAAGYRDSRPIPLKAVYVAPPFHRRKERFKSVSVEILRQTGETLETAALKKFAEDVRRAREGGAQ